MKEWFKEFLKMCLGTPQKTIRTIGVILGLYIFFHPEVLVRFLDNLLEVAFTALVIYFIWNFFKK